ncbi:hypothetical protein JB92DRAFT_2832528 [Gautieria morchelliformis]|nr:hypothetical protein JB92DRAFT_2832528 [Gautieria morchelliformis]
MTTEYITSVTSGTHGGSMPQVSSKLSPDVALAVKPGDCADQHSFIQAGSITRVFNLKGYIIRTNHNHITYYFKDAGVTTVHAHERDADPCPNKLKIGWRLWFMYPGAPLHMKESTTMRFASA